ncbi:MAG: hypothetical protein WCK02_02035 [Bacteroidota bacterium]
MLNLSAIPTLIEKQDTIFSIQFIDKQGKTITMNNTVCLSSHYKPRTYNIRQLDSGEIRTIRHISIVAFNGEETYY